MIRAISCTLAISGFFPVYCGFFPVSHSGHQCSSMCGIVSVLVFVTTRLEDRQHALGFEKSLEAYTGANIRRHADEAQLRALLNDYFGSNCNVDSD